MLPNLTNQYISYSIAVFSANEIRTFLSYPPNAAVAHVHHKSLWVQTHVNISRDNLMDVCMFRGDLN